MNDTSEAVESWTYFYDLKFFTFYCFLYLLLVNHETAFKTFMNHKPQIKVQ